jgi:valyl-tRNA synthetase
VALVKDFEEPIKSLGKLESITFQNQIEPSNECAIAVVGHGKIAIEIGQASSLKNPALLIKEHDKLGKEIEVLSGRLGNENFVAKAPAEALAKARQDLKDKKSRLEQIKDLLRP